MINMISPGLLVGRVWKGIVVSVDTGCFSRGMTELWCFRTA